MLLKIWSLSSQEIVSGFRILEGKNIKDTRIQPNHGSMSVKMEEK